MTARTSRKGLRRMSIKKKKNEEPRIVCPACGAWLAEVNDIYDSDGDGFDNDLVESLCCTCDHGHEFFVRVEYETKIKSVSYC